MSQSQISAFVMMMPIVVGLCATSAAQTLAWVSFPGEQWESITPERAGLDEIKFNAWVASQKPKYGVAHGGQQPESGGVVITRGEYILHTWGDPTFKFQSASLGKTFTRMTLELAIDEGLIENSVDLVRDYWTGERLLAPHKIMTRGHNAEVSFDLLQNMKAGVPVTNGYLWRTKDATGIMGPKVIPRWANYTGDPDHDNYAHAVPGTTSRYSSGGYWRLSQALTAIWDKDLKQVLDERIMSKIGIPASRWDWLTGEQVRKNRNFYPDMPGYGDYLDAPYRLNEIPVRGGPGWVVMSAEDLARLGLLVAAGGVWKGERLISKIGGNTGVGANTMNGWNVVHNKAGYFSFGKVATRFRDPTADEMASWITGPVKVLAEQDTALRHRQRAQ